MMKKTVQRSKTFFVEKKGKLFLKLRAKTNTTRFALFVEDQELVACVTNRAIKGKANKEILKELADILHTPKSMMEIVKGSTNSHKTIQIFDTLRKEDFENILNNLKS